MKHLQILIVFILLLINLQAKGLEKISLQLDWLHQFQFAGYYIAKEKGFYKDENLDVEIKEFNFNINLLDNVLKTTNEYAVGKSSLIIDRLENKKIVLLAAIYQNSPMVLISLKNSHINTPSDLKNKKVMLTPDARSAASINSMIISQGLKLSDINFQQHSFKLDDLINGKTDAMGCYLSNEPYHLSKKNIDFTIHNPSKYGFDFYGGLLFTSENELKENPIRVRKMYKATLKGWEYAFNNIEDTAKLIFDKYNTQNKSLESLIFEGKELKKLAKFDEGLLGNIDYKRVEEMRRLYLLLALGKNNTKFKIEDLVYNPNNIIYSNEEKEYLKNNKLILLSNDSFPPFTMKKNDSVSGMEIEYWKLINEKIKIKDLNIEIIDSNKVSRERIKENKNLTKYAFSKNDNNKYFKLTNTIANIKIGLATLNDKAYLLNPSELNNKRIAIAKYSSIFKTFKSKYPKINFVEINDIEEGLRLLNNEQVYGLIGKVPALSYHISSRSLTNTKIAGTFDEKYELKLLINSSNKILLNILNESISLISDEEKNIINSKYYSLIYKTTKDYSWIYKIVIPLIIILIFIIFTNRKLYNEIKKRKEIEKKLNKVANTDGLTNIYNRRKIELLYNSELKRVKRYHRELSIIFFDIDDFKSVNDQLGHAIGDEVLIELCSIVKNNIRSIDYFGRWGGEEFIIILPETNKEKASNLANILKNKIHHHDFNINKTITCSFGVAQFEDTDSEDTLLTRADDAMYYVKRNGRNNVKVD